MQQINIQHMLEYGRCTVEIILVLQSSLKEEGEKDNHVYR